MKNLNLRNAIVSLEVDDGILMLRKLGSVEHLRGHFSESDWENIFPGCSDLSKFYGFCDAAGELVAFYDVVSVATGSSIGFLMPFIDDERKPGTVSIHGGGWLRALGASRMFLRSFRLMAQMLAAQGFKVHISVRRDLHSVLRFDRAAGFVPYRYSSSRVYLRFKP